MSQSDLPIRFRIGKRVYVRAPEKSDVPLITAWINDPRINEFLTTLFPLPTHLEEEWALKKRGDEAVFVIVKKRTNQPIGMVGLHKIHHVNGTAETGSYVCIPEQNKGYGTEARMLVLEYAFNTLNLRKICSSVYAFNPQSKRSLEKCGYIPDGVRKDHVFRKGKVWDLHNFALFRNAFEKKWKEVMR